MPVSPNTPEIGRPALKRPDRQPSVWALRFETIRAVLLLLRAQFLIRFVPMARWHSSLGQAVEVAKTDSVGSAQPDPAAFAFARARARRVERAAARLPWETSCLARAMALQWLLAPAGCATRLVIAMQREDWRAEHGWHAWVELDEVMLIGQCDPTRYHRVLCFAR
ncbi:MAG: hypothetical protein C0510_05940 [Erythrobacter sp.]|nr:hypothetical protein [Erythrobacter sp.]